MTSPLPPPTPTVMLDTTPGSASGDEVVVGAVVLLEDVVGGAVLVAVVVGGIVVAGVVTVVEAAGIVVVDAACVVVIDEFAVVDVQEETPRSSPKVRTAVFPTQLSMVSSYTQPPTVDSQHPLLRRGRRTPVDGIPTDDCLSCLWLWASSIGET